MQICLAQQWQRMCAETGYEPSLGNIPVVSQDLSLLPIHAVAQRGEPIAGAGHEAVHDVHPRCVVQRDPTHGRPTIDRQRSRVVRRRHVVSLAHASYHRQSDGVGILAGVPACGLIDHYCPEKYALLRELFVRGEADERGIWRVSSTTSPQRTISLRGSTLSPNRWCGSDMQSPRLTWHSVEHFVPCLSCSPPNKLSRYELRLLITALRKRFANLSTVRAEVAAQALVAVVGALLDQVGERPEIAQVAQPKSRRCSAATSPVCATMLRRRLLVDRGEQPPTPPWCASPQTRTRTRRRAAGPLPCCGIG